MNDVLKKFRDAVKEIQRNHYFEVRIVKDGDYLKLHDDDDISFIFTALTREINFTEEDNVFRWRLLQPADTEFWDFLKIIQNIKEEDEVSLELSYLSSNGDTVGAVSHDGITLERFDLSSIDQAGKDICCIQLIMKYRLKRVV